MTHEPTGAKLKRELGLTGAVMMGLGSIVGTGVFVSIGIAAGIAGPAAVPAVILVAPVAMCNAFSSAQLAANHAVSGGTYEYGYRYLHPVFGFTAGWMFLWAKSASAATAALGFAGYVRHVSGHANGADLRPLGFAVVAVLTAVVLGGISRSNAANTVIVSVTLISLVAFVAAGIPVLAQAGTRNLIPLFPAEAVGTGDKARALLHACALMFVAYTGYGRIATLGEEVRDPRHTIPKAIVTTLIVSAALYAAVAVVAVGAAGADALRDATARGAAPLEAAALSFNVPGIPRLVAVGAVTAMLGVLLNLILGLSRVLLAMGRRGDMPRAMARLNAGGTTPRNAVLAVGILIACLTLVGSVKTTWSFSAFTVLVYYAITNLAALRLTVKERLFPRVFPICGLCGCLFLAFRVDPPVWIAGLALIAAGLVWHAAARKLA